MSSGGSGAGQGTGSRRGRPGWASEGRGIVRRREAPGHAAAAAFAAGFPHRLAAAGLQTPEQLCLAELLWPPGRPWPAAREHGRTRQECHRLGGCQGSLLAAGLL